MKELFKNIVNKRHAMIFLLIIFLPLFLLLTGMGNNSSTMENRSEKFPEISIRDLHIGLKNFEKYYEKKFPFRKKILYQRNYLYSRYIGVSPVDRVILGKEKWLFLRRLNDIDSEINYSISIDKFKKHELEYWFNLFRERYQFLKKRGIELLIVLVPNKSTIYSEYLPDSIRKVTGGIRAEQLKNYFDGNSEIKVLYLKDLLLANKGVYPVYHRTDSHWTHYGAWLAYREIIVNLSQRFKGAVPFEFEKFPKRKMKTPSKADLASMLALNKSFYREDFQRLFTPPGSGIRHSRLKRFKYKKIRTEVYSNKNGTLPKTIMIHDSFGRGLKKFMAATFSEIIFLRDWGFNFFPDLIEREKPEIVIYELAERFLYRPVPENRK